MPLPKRRHSPSRRDKRRTHDNLPVPAVCYCSHCHAPTMPHNACSKCGYYGGRQVDHTIKTKDKEK
ncbi:MAG: 50S ribosomal protein L32 [Armatimonadota bacterium]